MPMFFCYCRLRAQSNLVIDSKQAARQWQLSIEGNIFANFIHQNEITMLISPSPSTLVIWDTLMQMMLLNTNPSPETGEK